MGFVLTLLYIAITLLSPGVLPEAIWSLHVNLILGLLAILVMIPSLRTAKLGSFIETYCALGLLLATTLSIVMTGWLGGAVQAFLGFCPIVFAFYFISTFCQSLKKLKILVAVLTAAAIFVLAQGAFAYFSGNFQSLYLEPEGVSGSVLYRFRGLGVISDPNDLAQFFVMLLPLLWLRWKPGQGMSNFLFTIVPAGILASGIYFTHSRGGSLAFIAVLLFGFKDKLGVVKSSVLAGILLMGMLAVNIGGGRGINEDDGDRVGLWSQSLTVFKSHPLFGIGIGNLSDYTETAQTAHNSYVLCLAETGVFGYFFWMGMIVASWSGLSQIIRRGGTESSTTETSAEDGWDNSRERQAALVNPYLRLSATDQTAVAIGPRAIDFSGLSMHATRPVGADVRLLSMGQREEDDSTGEPASGQDSLIRAAKLLRVSFVGLLVTSFFLSRAFAVLLYVLLGMSFALKIVCSERQPDLAIKVTSFVKWTGVVMFGTVVFMYLFVRIHGAH
jgi:O-antigen ligase